jgi:hypothetical protein
MLRDTPPDVTRGLEVSEVPGEAYPSLAKFVGCVASCMQGGVGAPSAVGLCREMHGDDGRHPSASVK